jgi:dihydroneopterin aldolase
MAIPNKLIEKVAKRIVDKIKIFFPTSLKVKVKVTKFNPPINGDVKYVAVTIEE